LGYTDFYLAFELFSRIQLGVFSVTGTVHPNKRGAPMQQSGRR